ncbi:microtubule-associated protein 10-like isoform X2 [Actinia tenebrosa]|nr:microtubule-associated protein 10-like isoform X2 [Actinia tenebrosa]
MKKSESEKQDSETQTVHPMPTACKRLQIKKPTYSEDAEEDVFPVTNTVCPPPLYYNFMSHSENTSKKRSERQEQKEAYKSKTSCEANVDDIDFIYYKPDLLQPDGSTGCASVCIQTDVGTAQPVVSNHKTKEDIGEIEKRLNSEDLPLLNALLEELTSLRKNKQTHSAPVTKTNTPKKENILSEKSRQISRPRECCVRSASQKSVLLKNKKQNQLVPKKVKFKPTNLTYGTTRTQQMRLEMNQKGKVKNPRTSHTGTEHKKSLSMSAYSRERKEIIRNLIPKDFGKTQTIFTSPGAGEGSVTVSAGVQTDDVLLQSVIPTSDAKSKQPTSENLGNTVTVKKQQNDDTPADFGTSSQNSLDIYLPQVKGDSDGSSNFGPASDQVSSDDVPLPDLPTTTKYGHTGIRSPDLAQPIRRQSVTSPPIRSRTSTALSMYSDDFEESLIWEAKSRTDDDESDTSSHTSSISHLSANSQVKDRDVSRKLSSSDINDNFSQPIRSNFSPKKSKKMKEKERKSDQDDNRSVERSFEEDSKSDEGRTALDTPDVNKESLFDSLNSPNPDDHLEDGTSTREGNDDNLNVLQLPRPAIDLGYTY